MPLQYLGYPLSLDMQAFQIWYLAMYAENTEVETDLVVKCRKAFPDFQSSRKEKLDRGADL